MSPPVEYQEFEQELARHLARLRTLERHPGMRKELEFENKLHALLTEYAKALHEAISILDPAFCVTSFEPPAFDPHVSHAPQPYSRKSGNHRDASPLEGAATGADDSGSRNGRKGQLRGEGW